MKEYKQFRDTNYYVDTEEWKLWHLKIDEKSVKVFIEVKPQYKDKHRRENQRDRVMIGDKHFKIHRIVYEVAYGFAPSSVWDIHHVDFDHTNNNPENLMIISREDHRELHRRERNKE